MESIDLSKSDLTQRIEEALRGVDLQPRSKVSLAPLCTYRVGGAADIYIEIDDAEELQRLARAFSTLVEEHPRALGLINVVGKGSNLLVAHAGVRGLVIRLGEHFEGVEILDRTQTRATVLIGAAAALPVSARRLAAQGLTGFEWAVGIPGSMGGAVRMNAGGHGADLASVLTRVHLCDLRTGEAVSMNAAQLELGYRRSALRSHQLVVAAEVDLEVGDAKEAERRLSEIVRWRREHQPGGANAGSVFTNPPGDSAGRLIDAAGCRGMRIGSAEVSTKHANFIQVDPDGNSDDVMELMKAVVERVRAEHQVTLHAETVLLGFDSRDVAAVKSTEVRDQR